MSDIVFVGNGRCYHTIDWYRNAKRLCYPRRVLYATDLIDSEGHVKILTTDDDVVDLYNIDWLLLKKQSAFGNAWRNLIKTLLIPLQVMRLKRIARFVDAHIYHAHSTYYMYLCWLAGVPYVGTPQGSEVLVRPHRSRLYRHFAVKSLLGAAHITVDSVDMQKGVRALCGREAMIVQNGIDIAAICRYTSSPAARSGVVSIRGFHPLYRIDDIIRARAASARKPRITLTYPLWEDDYKAEVSRRLEPGDLDLGRVMPKERLYEILSSALLAISIPASDSSPRTVYEAIFCGCCVAVTHSSWVDALPACMKARLVTVDLNDPRWLDTALARAEAVTKEPYRPSPEAAALFDQNAAAKVVADMFYGN